MCWIKQFSVQFVSEWWFFFLHSRWSPCFNDLTSRYDAENNEMQIRILDFFLNRRIIDCFSKNIKAELKILDWFCSVNILFKHNTH